MIASQAKDWTPAVARKQKTTPPHLRSWRRERKFPRDDWFCGFAAVEKRPEFRQCIFFMSCPHAQRGLRTLVASNESFTTSISQQHLEFTQRYLSFFFMAMIRSPVD
jgi:hypothetical protein